MKRTLVLLSTLVLTLSVSACSNNKSKESSVSSKASESSEIISSSQISESSSQSINPVLNNYAIHRDEEFGGAYINISIQAFNNLGFKFGDSLDLAFSNDVKYEDIGYYSGYYVPAGQELVVGYPGYDYIKFCINYGDDVYAKHNFNTDTKVTITVNEEQKYKDIEETLSISYSDDVTKYESEEQFANFREITAGRAKPGLLYRGASPIDDSRKRSAVVDSLLQKNGIQYNIDLADKEESVYGENPNKKYVVHDYFQSLKDDNKVVFLGMAAAYKNDDFSNKMKTLFLSILNNDGPYYIHCLEGKDRTGYVCMVIEALLGASYDELIEDYFITYHNYYGIEKGTNKYDVIKSMHIDEMIRFVFDFDKGTLLLGANFKSKANSYLLAIGLTQEQIDAVQTKLAKDDHTVELS